MKEVPLFQSNTLERTSGLMYFSLHANPTRSPVSRVIMDFLEEISRLHCSNRLMKQGPRLHITNSTSVYLAYRSEFRLDLLKFIAIVLTSS